MCLKLTLDACDHVTHNSNLTNHDSARFEPQESQARLHVLCYINNNNLIIKIIRKKNAEMCSESMEKNNPSNQKERKTIIKEKKLRKLKFQN